MADSLLENAHYHVVSINICLWLYPLLRPNIIIGWLMVCCHFRAWVGREFILFYFLFYFFVEKRGRQGIVMDYFFIERIGKQGIYFIL